MRSSPAANKVFVDREHLLKVFEDAAFAIPPERARLLVFYGIGGQGKTALCRELWRTIGSDPSYSFLCRAELDLHGRPKTDPDLLLVWIRNGFAKAGVVLPCFDLAFTLAWDATRHEQAMPHLDSGWLARRKEEIGETATDLIAALKEAIGEAATGVPVLGAVIRSVGGWTIRKGFEAYLRQTQGALGELYRDGELKKPYELSALLPWMLAQDLNQHLVKHPTDRFALLIDEYERVFDEGGAGVRWKENPFDRHLREFVKETNGLLAVFFSRERLPWEDDPQWRPDLDGAQHALGGLADKDADQLLRMIPIADKAIRAAMIEGARETSTPGAPVYPLMLDLQIEHWESLAAQARPIEPDGFHVAAPDFEGRRRELVDRVLRDYRQPLQVTLRRLSFARQFDRPAFEHVVKTFQTGLPLDAFETIAGMSFVTPTEDGFLIFHGVVAEAIRELLDEETRRSSLEALLDHYERRATATLPSDVTDQTISALLEAAYLRRQIGTSGYVEWLSQITAPMETASRHIACEQIWREALTFIENELDANHPDALACYLRLAYSLNGQKRGVDAEPIIRRALAISEKELGTAHPVTATAYSYLAHSLHGTRSHSEAEELVRKALDIRKRVLGEDHTDTASSYSNLAFVLTAQKRENEAEPFVRKALDIRRRLLGEDHPETATAYAVLAHNLIAQSRALEAESLNRKALDIRVRVLGEGHPQTTTSYIGLASSLTAQGREKEAEPLIRKALDIRERTLGEDHPDTAAAYINLAYNLTSQRQNALLSEAEALIRKALAMRRKVQGERHPDTATNYALLAQNLALQGRKQDAEPIARMALDIRRQVLGEDHSDTADGYLSVARNLTEQRRQEEAEPFLRQVLAIRQRVLGDEHAETARAYVMLASNLEGQNRAAEAEPYRRKVLAIREHVLGEEHPDTVRSYLGLVDNLNRQSSGEYSYRAPNFLDIFGFDMNCELDLAHDLNRQGRHKEAEAIYCGLLNIGKEKFGERHPFTAARYSGLAWNLTDQGRHKEAEPLFRNALEINTQVHGANDTRTAKSHSAVVENLRRQGHFEEAAQLQPTVQELSDERDNLRKLLDNGRRARDEAFESDITGKICLAYDLDSQGCHEEASLIFREVLGVSQHVFGEQHPYTACSYLRLAHHLSTRQCLKEAEPLFRKALEIYTEAHGPEHARTTRSQRLLVDNLNRQRSDGETEAHNQTAEGASQNETGTRPYNVPTAGGSHLDNAETILRKVVDIRRRVLGQEHQDTASAYSQLAYNLGVQKRYSEAEPLTRTALGIRERLFGGEHPETLKSRGQLIESLRLQGRDDEAEKIAQQAPSLNRRSRGGKHGIDVTSELDIAYDLVREGRHDAAETVFRNLLDMSKRELGGDHPYTASMYHRLANFLATQRRYQEAEPLVQKALEINTRSHGPDHPQTRKSRKALEDNLKRQEGGDNAKRKPRKTPKDNNYKTQRQRSDATHSPAEPAKEVDPDSPFAALAALRQQLKGPTQSE